MNNDGRDENRHDYIEDATRVFQEKYAWATKIFREYREGSSFVNRVNREILRAMCESEGLATSGTKVDLFARLNKWVCRFTGWGPH
jgi:hypothetical protein